MDAGDNCTAANVQSFQTQEPTHFTFKLAIRGIAQSHRLGSKSDTLFFGSYLNMNSDLKMVNKVLRIINQVFELV